MSENETPSIRIRAANDQPVQDDGDYVLYWMTAFRRARYNFSLQRAVEWARKLGKPLVVFEALRCEYRWASDRLHHFVIQGMADNAESFGKFPVTYYPYLEMNPGDGRGLFRELANRACVVIGDDFPCFFLPRMIAAAAKKCPTQFELVDSNGLLPMRAADKVFSRAYHFRRFLQKTLLPHLIEAPQSDPLKGVKLPKPIKIAADVLDRWPVARPNRLLAQPNYLQGFPIDHSVLPSDEQGGMVAAGAQLKEFIDRRLSGYDADRNQPEQSATSELSAYLHFGHLSAHEVFAEITEASGWSPDAVAEKATGSADGWWGAEPEVESYLDELITWRELGYNMCWQRDDYDQYESLPDWAQQTLEEHADDARDPCYTLEQLEHAKTHDELWNAAQSQLVTEGRIHNYLRMLWGKKILEWSSTPQEALENMVELNNKYALDGRNPNSYSGIFWVLGRYDRAWGPERPIFGKIRYMSSENTARKVRVKNYVAKYTSKKKQSTMF